jgi:colicin import membrane protein
VERVVQSLARVKLEVSDALDSVTRDLADQVRCLAKADEANRVAAERLKEMHAVEVAADSLSILIAEHERRQAEFESRMTEQQTAAEVQFNTAKQTVETAITDMQQAWAEERERLMRERQREADEYNYRTKTERARDSDAYQAKKQALETELRTMRLTQEKQLTEREQVVAAREQELLQLRADVEAWPAKLDKAVAKAQAETRQQAEREAKIASEMRDKSLEGERQVAQVCIANFEAKVKEQAQRIEQLNGLLAEATNKVENIASRAIEGAAGRAALAAVNEIAMQQAKQARPD